MDEVKDVFLDRALVEREADISLKKNFKCTALHLAAHGGHTEVVEYLIHCKAGIKEVSLELCRIPIPRMFAILLRHVSCS